MSVGATSGVILNGDVAQGAVRPWPPLLLGIAGIVACWATRPTSTAFAVSVFVAQLCTMVIIMAECTLRPRQCHPGQYPSLSPGRSFIPHDHRVASGVVRRLSPVRR